MKTGLEKMVEWCEKYLGGCKFIKPQSPLEKEFNNTIDMVKDKARQLQAEEQSSCTNCVGYKKYLEEFKEGQNPTEYPDTHLYTWEEAQKIMKKEKPTVDKGLAEELTKYLSDNRGIDQYDDLNQILSQYKSTESLADKKEEGK